MTQHRLVCHLPPFLFYGDPNLQRAIGECLGNAISASMAHLLSTNIRLNGDCWLQVCTFLWRPQLRILNDSFWSFLTSWKWTDSSEICGLPNPAFIYFFKNSCMPQCTSILDSRHVCMSFPIILQSLSLSVSFSLQTKRAAYVVAQL